MSHNNSGESFIKGAFFGLVAGAVAGILLAPKSGEETREDLKKFALEMKDRAEDLYTDAKKEIARRTAQLKKAGEKIDETKYKQLVSEVIEEIKKDSSVTSSVAQKLSAQLKSDWKIVEQELKS